MARRYDWVRVNNGRTTGKHYERLNTEKKILMPFLENHGGFWVVTLDNDEFVQWSIEGYFEHWKDDQMVDKTYLPDNRLAIKKLYVDILEF